jgi:hypothetical protein
VKPKVVIADVGYGSGENYRYLENQKIRAVVKYGMYRIEEATVGGGGNGIGAVEREPGVQEVSAAGYEKSEYGMGLTGLTEACPA